MLVRVKHAIATVTHLPMKRAIDNKDTDTILQLIGEHADDAEYLNFPFTNKGTLLQWALRMRKVQVVVRLLSLKTTTLHTLETPVEVINELDERGESFFEYLVDNGNISSDVAALIRMPFFNVNAKDRGHKPMLFCAINRVDNEFIYGDVLQAFLSHEELDLAANNNLHNAYTYAVTNGKNYALRVLIADKGCIGSEKAPKKNRTALSAACEMNKEEAALIILESKKFDILEPDAEGFSAFSYACNNGMESIVTYMLDNYKLPADHPQVIKGLTLLIKQLKSQQDERIKMNESLNDIHDKIEELVDLGLAVYVNFFSLLGYDYDREGLIFDKILAHENFYPYTKLQTDEYGECNFFTYCLGVRRPNTMIYKMMDKLAVAQPEHDEHMQSMWFLVKHCGNRFVLQVMVERFDCKLNAVDSAGNSFLHYAAALPNNGDMISHLLHFENSGIDPNQKNNAGETPLHVAALRGDSKGVDQFLCHAKVDINAQNAEGKTAAMILIQRNNREDFRKLCTDKRIDLSIKDNSGKNIAIYAVHHGIFDDVKFILEKSFALVNEGDLAGNTALHYLIDKEDDVPHVKAMLRLGADPHLINSAGQNCYIAACAVDHHKVASHLLSVAPHLAQFTTENINARVSNVAANYQPGHFQVPRQGGNNSTLQAVTPQPGKL